MHLCVVLRHSRCTQTIRLACSLVMRAFLTKSSVPHADQRNRYSTTPHHIKRTSRVTTRIHRGSPGNARGAILRQRGFVEPAHFCKRPLINIHHTSVTNDTLFCCISVPLVLTPTIPFLATTPASLAPACHYRARQMCLSSSARPTPRQSAVSRRRGQLLISSRA